MISSLGIGSGVLTSDLLDQLVEAERAPTQQRLDRREEDINVKVSEFGKIQSLVQDLRLPARTLSNPDALRSLTASSSQSAVGATISDDQLANPGQFNVDVTQLAAARSLATGDFADADSTTVGTGTLSIKVGDTTKNLTIDSSNNTLNGIANEINKADFGATANVVDTGSAFRLVISSEETGLANAVEISVTDNDGNSGDTSGLSQLAFNDTVQNLTETVTAADAQFSVNGIDVTRSSNTVEGVISGVTLNLNNVTSGTPATVTISRDTAQVVERVQNFVDAFNALQSKISELTEFNPETNEGGVFLGDSAVREVTRQVESVLRQVIPGLEDANVRTLADVGITTNSDNGQLEFNSVLFSEKLSTNPQDVAALFSEQGRTSDSQVEFLTSSVNTQPGTFDINITQAATQGTFTGNQGITGPITIDGTNDEFTLRIDDQTDASITLTQQTFNTAADLVAEIQAQLDANDSLNSAGIDVQVGLDASNQLVFTSGSFGSASRVDVTAVDTNTSSTLGLSVAQGTAGQDVAGTINGKAATGEGQILTAAEDDPSSGIALRITGTATGDRGTVTFIEGVGERMVSRINNLLGADGTITARNEFFQSQLNEIDEQREALDRRIANFRERLQAQFTAADALVAQLNNTERFITQQFQAFAGTTPDN